MRILSSIQPGLYALKIAASLLVISFLIASCAKSAAIDEHPDFVNTLRNRMDTSKNEHIDASFIFIDSVFANLKKPGIGDVFTNDSTKSIKYRLVKHDFTRSISLLDSLLILLKDKTSEERYAERYVTTLYQKGECFADMKQYKEALYYFSQAEEAAFHLVKNKCNIIYFTGLSAYLMFNQEKYLEAATAFLKQSRVLIDNCNEPDGRQMIILQRCQNNVALSYLRAGIPDSAIFYQSIALNTITENENKFPASRLDFLFAKAVIYGDQAEVFTLKGRYAEAEALYKISIRGTGASDISYTQQTMSRLADVYLKDSKTDSAGTVLNQLKLFLDTFPGEERISWYKLSVKYYTQSNQLASAFKYQQQFEKLRDSAEARDKKFISVDVAKEFENLELKYANEVLQKEGKLKSLYLIIAVIIFIAVAVITCFTWYNLKRTRKLHSDVAQKNDALQKALSSLEQSHTENNRIIRIVAHDLKNPVSAINNLIFSLLRKEHTEDLKEIFGVIKTACSNSMVLINDVLNQTKNKTAIRTEQVDMKRLLEYCVSLLQAKATEKNQFLTLQAEDVLVMLNRQKMWRVVSNIINNAIKFSPEYTTIDVKLERKSGSIVLSVHDNGIGIPENLKDKIFSMSPEASRPGTFGEESYGLGLTISQKIIEEHNGKIWFDSNNGRGSVFYVELPCLN